MIRSILDSLRRNRSVSVQVTPTDKRVPANPRLPENPRESVTTPESDDLQVPPEAIVPMTIWMF